MKTVNRTIEGRDFWFTVDQTRKEDPDTGELIETGQYYCAFSMQKPGPTNHGEVLKDERGRARLFPTYEQALAAGLREVNARVQLPSKVYGVGLPRGIMEREFGAYVELLKRHGIPVEDPARMSDIFGRRWPHVWDTREEAERFAAELRQLTRKRDWEVYELSPPAPPLDEQDERSVPLVILVGRQSEGNTYSLHPESAGRLREQQPSARQRASVFITHEARAGYEIDVSQTYDHVAMLLTGLSPEGLLEVGGYRVIDPITDLVLYEAAPARK